MSQKVIPLVHILHCTNSITFLAHPVCKVSIKYYVNIAMMISLFITYINSFSPKVNILCYNYLQNKQFVVLIILMKIL